MWGGGEFGVICECQWVNMVYVWVKRWVSVYVCVREASVPCDDPPPPLDGSWMDIRGRESCPIDFRSSVIALFASRLGNRMLSCTSVGLYLGLERTLVLVPVKCLFLCACWLDVGAFVLVCGGGCVCVGVGGGGGGRGGT